MLIINNNDEVRLAVFPPFFRVEYSDYIVIHSANCVTDGATSIDSITDYTDSDF